MSIIIEPIPFYETNYAWLVVGKTNKAIVIDPGDANPIMKTLNEKKLLLQVILITHFHNDHIGGVRTLKNTFGCQVIGPLKEADKIGVLDVKVGDKDLLDFDGLGLGQAEVICTPGHTLGSICYYLPKFRMLFTGDTLFSLGCGRLFEGTYLQMFNSLQKLASYPDDTNIYCAHEYTLDNGRFAETLPTRNDLLKERMAEVIYERQNNRPTLPISLSVEKQTNPFLMAKTLKLFTALRKAKDHF